MRSVLTPKNLTCDERFKNKPFQNRLEGIFLWKRVIIHLRVDLYNDFETIVIRNSYIDVFKVCFEFDYWNK